MSLITFPSKHPHLPIHPCQPLAKKMTTTASVKVFKTNRRQADPIRLRRVDGQEDLLVLLGNNVDVLTNVSPGGILGRFKKHQSSQIASGIQNLDLLNEKMIHDFFGIFWGTSCEWKNSILNTGPCNNQNFQTSLKYLTWYINRRRILC